MSLDLILTLVIIAIAVFLFIKDYFSIDTTSILIMGMFIVAGVLDYEEGFSGFNHPATITLGCLFVVSHAIFKSGIIDGLAGHIAKAAKTNYLVALVLLCAVSATFSAFINDAAVVSILIPVALSVSRNTGISPSRLLIPISFSALFGGTCTLIGTSTNILVTSYAIKAGLEPFGVFDFAAPALVLLVIGLGYIFIFSPLFLPKRSGDEKLNISKKAEEYIVEIALTDENEDVGKIIKNSTLVKDIEAQVISLNRDGEIISEPGNNYLLKAGDLLKVMVEPTKIQAIKSSKSFEFTKRGEQMKLDEGMEDNRKLFEVMLPTGSMLAGKNLRELSFAKTYKSMILGIRHREETKMTKLSEITLKEGDMLLMQSDPGKINFLEEKKAIIVLSEFIPKVIDYKKAIPAILIAIGVVGAAALDLTTILMSGMIGCLLLVTTGILKPKEAYEAIDWKVIFMMAGVLSMGTALEKTGGSELLSALIYSSIGNLDPRIALSLIFLVTFLSTNVLSSKASAALMSPIVISLASAMQVSERPFLVAVMFACSLTFMTPVGYPVNTMVYAPGNYKFNDFLKFGTPLNILIWIAASFIIPYFIPF